jgi:hypothetical protein
MELQLNPGSTQEDFFNSEASMPVLIGPLGEGKTWACIWKAILHWYKFKDIINGALRGFVVRDTHQNMKRMTVPSINKALRGYFTPLWKDDYKKLIIKGVLDFDLIGIDNPGSLNKIQGFEGGAGWLEEPAPMIEKGNVGLSLDVFLTAMTRVCRADIESGHQDEYIPLLMTSMNPADQDHWTYPMFVENPPKAPEGFPNLRVETFHIKHGENEHLPQVSREAAKMMFKDSPALYQRYVEGKFAFVCIGKKVTGESYNPDIHRSKERLDPIPGARGVRFWDTGLNPTCIIGQITPKGRLFILDSFRGDGIGMQQHIDTFIKPIMLDRYKEVTEWRDIADPAISNREQSNSEHTAAKIIEEELNTCVEYGAKNWDPRKQAVTSGLNRLVDGQPFILISKHEGILHRALLGGWHYKTDPGGNVIGGQNAKPVKDIHSHPGDAFSYGLSLILGTIGRTLKQPAPPMKGIFTRLRQPMLRRRVLR